MTAACFASALVTAFACLLSSLWICGHEGTERSEEGTIRIPNTLTLGSHPPQIVTLWIQRNDDLRLILSPL